MATLANRNNNPGNLRYVGQEGATQGEGGFARFDSPQEGYAAMLNDLQGKLSGQNSHGLTPDKSLVDLIKVYAPASDNNTPASYAAAVANQMGVRPDITLKELQPKLGQLAEAMAQHEGYKGQSSYSGSNAKGFVDSSQYDTTPQPITESTTVSVQAPQTNQEPGLGQELLNRGQQASGAIQDTISGKINPLSGIIQTVGAVAGGVGDIVNKGLELIPGVKQVENLIGQGAGALAQTPVGKSVMQSIKDFSTQHPELANDIGAGVNIVTAIPILRGLGAVGGILKNATMDSVSSSLKNLAEKGLSEGIIKDLTTKTDLKMLANNPKGISTMIENRFIPDIESVGGIEKYNTTEALKAVDDALSAHEDNVYQPALLAASQAGVETRIPVSMLESKAKKLAIEEQISPNQLLKEIKYIKNKYGDYLSINQVNEAKRTVANRISQAGFNNPTLTTDKLTRELLQKTTEDMGTTLAKTHPDLLNIDKIHEMNQYSRNLFQAQKVLEALNGKKLNSSKGLLPSLISHVPGGKTYLNAKELISPTEIKKKVYSSVLKRTAPDYVKQSFGSTIKQTGKKVGLLTSLAEAQRANRKLQSTPQ